MIITIQPAGGYQDPTSLDSVAAVKNAFWTASSGDGTYPWQDMCTVDSAVVSVPILGHSSVDRTIDHAMTHYEGLLRRLAE